MRFIRYVFTILIPLSLCSLSAVGCTESSVSSPAITISSGSISIGADGENTDRQTLTFHWQLKNNSSEEVLLESVQPNPSDELADRLLTEVVLINVGKVISPGETIEVQGAFTFDASGLTKQDLIEKFQITDITLSTQSTIQVNMTGTTHNQDIT